VWFPVSPLPSYVFVLFLFGGNQMLCMKSLLCTVYAFFWEKKILNLYLNCLYHVLIHFLNALLAEENISRMPVYFSFDKGRFLQDFLYSSAVFGLKTAVGQCDLTQLLLWVFSASRVCWMTRQVKGSLFDGDL